MVVGLSIGGGADPSEISEGIRTLGPVVLFLGQPTAVFDYDPSVFAMVEGGALLATVSPDGRLHLPVKSPEEEAALLGRTGTLEQLRTAARGAGSGDPGRLRRREFWSSSTRWG